MKASPEIIIYGRSGSHVPPEAHACILPEAEAAPGICMWVHWREKKARETGKLLWSCQGDAQWSAGEVTHSRCQWRNGSGWAKGLLLCFLVESWSWKAFGLNNVKINIEITVFYRKHRNTLILFPENPFSLNLLEKVGCILLLGFCTRGGGIKWNWGFTRQSPAESFPLEKTTLHKTSLSLHIAPSISLAMRYFLSFAGGGFWNRAAGFASCPVSPMSICPPGASKLMDEESQWMQDPAPSWELAH